MTEMETKENQKKDFGTATEFYNQFWEAVHELKGIPSPSKIDKMIAKYKKRLHTIAVGSFTCVNSDEEFAQCQKAYEKLSDMLAALTAIRTELKAKIRNAEE